MPTPTSVRDLHTTVKDTAFHPNDSLPRLVLAIIEDVMALLKVRESKVPPTLLLRGETARQAKDQALQWVISKSDKPFSLKWSCQVLNLAGMEISEEAMRERCLSIYKGAYRGQVRLTPSGTPYRRQSARIVPTGAGPERTNGSTSSFSSPPGDTQTSEPA